MDNSRTALAGPEAERRRAREARRAAFRRRLVAAAGIDPAALSPQARRILDWLAEWDEWITEGLVEILGAVRAAQPAQHSQSTATRVRDHRPDVAQ
jgi:hypothetical protein